jgi:hypothetical protein
MDRLFWLKIFLHYLSIGAGGGRHLPHSPALSEMIKVEVYEILIPKLRLFTKLVLIS